MTGLPVWREVALKPRVAWRAVFNNDRSSLDLPWPCPICRTTALHRWYFLEEHAPHTIHGRTFVGPGRLWEWCSSCGTYEHYQDAYVPDWWEAPFHLPESELRYDPGPVELARRALSD